jgi:hypothetical protein
MTKALIIDTIGPRENIIVFNENLDRFIFSSSNDGRVRIELEFGNYYFTYRDKKINVTLDKSRYTLKDIFHV